MHVGLELSGDTLDALAKAAAEQGMDTVEYAAGILSEAMEGKLVPALPVDAVKVTAIGDDGEVLGAWTTTEGGEHFPAQGIVAEVKGSPAPLCVVHFMVHNEERAADMTANGFSCCTECVPVLAAGAQWETIQRNAGRRDLEPPRDTHPDVLSWAMAHHSLAHPVAFRPDGTAARCRTCSARYSVQNGAAE